MTTGMGKVELQAAGRRRSRALITVMTIYVGVAVAVATGAFMEIGLLERMQTAEITLEEVEANDALVRALGFLEFGTMLTGMVFFARWFAVANRRAASQGAALVYGPGAWGWFFFPILNLWKPYRAVVELWSWRGENGCRPAPRVFGLWWLAWILGNLVARASAKARASEDVDRMIQGDWLDIIGTTLLAAAALALIRIVRLISASESDPAPEFATPTSFAPRRSRTGA